MTSAPAKTATSADAAQSRAGWIEMRTDPFALAFPIAITYACTRSVSASRLALHMISVNLDDRRLIIMDDEGDIGERTSSPTHEHRETRRPLTALQVSTIKADLDRALKQGPYEPEQVTGVPACVLELTVAGSAAPFFQIRKDRATTDDAITALIRDFSL